MLLAPLLLAARLSSAQPPAAPSTASAPSTPANATASDSTARRDRRTPRNLRVTPEMERTAFADVSARPLLLHARAARLAQDSALRAYDAKTYQRLSVGMGLRRLGRDRLLFRTESAAQVHWDRAGGVTVQPTGARSVSPVLDADGDADLSDISPIPYFPGRESLWFPSSGFGVAKAEVDDREFVHPLARGAEAYYRYATGDSMSLRLPDGRVIALREMRITARRPDWHLFVGSFWFDVERGQLVRAAYRMSEQMDIWKVAQDENEQELREKIERAMSDSGEAARQAIESARREAKDDEVPKWVKGMLNPMRATISTITVEYGLHEGRFWLPRRNVAEGEAQAGFLRVPVKVEESFRYDRVAGDVPRVAGMPGRPDTPPNAAPVAPAAPVPNAADRAPRIALADARSALDSALAREPADDSTADVVISIEGDGRRRNAEPLTPSQRTARADSAVREIMRRADSLQRRADSLQAAGDTARARRSRASANSRLRRAAILARRERQCAVDSVYDAGVRRRFEGALAMRVRMPCDSTALATSPDLPASPYDPGEELFEGADRDALVAALDLSLQPGWGPQPIRVRSGLDLARYNRVEALSVGAVASSALGAGYTAEAVGRIGVGDWVPNAELSISRSNGRRAVRLGAFHRLGVANDDWGGPLSFGASVASLLYARDEGFYYRTFGAELSGTRAAPFFGATVDWRLFGERQRTAGVRPNTQLSLGNVLGDARFIDNIDAQQVTTAGGALALARSFGVDPTGWRLLARSRFEAAAVRGSTLDRETSGYGRVMAEGTLSRGFGSVAASLTGAGGVVAGDAPVQRLFYLGGLQTVRGQFAKPTNEAGDVTSGYVGNAFWLGRAELGTNNVGFRPVVFFDAGWAGRRDDWSRPGRPLTGAGVGASFLDGLVRADLSRGIYPEKRVRFDLSVEARF